MFESFLFFMNVLTSIVYTISKIQQYKHQRRLEVVQNEITTHFMHSSISRSQPSTSTERSDESKVLPFNILKGRRRNAIGPIVDVEDPASNQPAFQMGSCCFKSVTINYLISIIFIVLYCIWMFGALNYVGLIHVIDIYKYVCDCELCIREEFFHFFFFLNLFFVAFPSESSTLQSCSPMGASSLGQLLWEMRKCKFTSKSNGMNLAFCFNGMRLDGGQSLSKEKERPQFLWQGVHHLRFWLKNLPELIVIDFTEN